MKTTIQCKVVQPGSNGNSAPRLIFSGYLWDEWDLTFCIHGEKLRWTCDACDEHFKKNPPRPRRERQRQQ